MNNENKKTIGEIEKLVGDSLLWEKIIVDLGESNNEDLKSIALTIKTDLISLRYSSALAVKELTNNENTV